MRRRSSSAPLVMDEAELPEVLREALKAARERMADKRARRARGEASTDDEDDEDDDEEFDVSPSLPAGMVRRWIGDSG